MAEIFSAEQMLLFQRDMPTWFPFVVQEVDSVTPAPRPPIEDPPLTPAPVPGEPTPDSPDAPSQPEPLPIDAA
jgi:hypothetical protein